MIASSTFAIKSDKLIELTREFLAANNGCDKPELLSDDFTFAGPVVGPIPKDEFIKAFSSFSITEAFPDMKPNFYNFHVDPFEHDRYVSRVYTSISVPMFDRSICFRFSMDWLSSNAVVVFVAVSPLSIQSLVFFKSYWNPHWGDGWQVRTDG